jgi:hypothetical protein
MRFFEDLLFDSDSGFRIIGATEGFNRGGLGKDKQRAVIIEEDGDELVSAPSVLEAIDELVKQRG